MATAQDRAHARVKALIKKVAEDDRSAFSKLYDQTSAKLFGICLRVTQDRDDAEACLQETYRRVWHGAGAYNPASGGPMTWMITVARETALEKLRQRREEDIPVDDLPELEDGQTDALPALAEEALERPRLAQCMLELSPSQSAALRGAYLDGDTYPTLAQRLDLPVTTVRKGLRSSIMKMREALGR